MKTLFALAFAFFTLTGHADAKKFVQAFEVQDVGATLVVTTIAENETRYQVNLGQPKKWLNIDVVEVIIGFSNTILQTKRGSIDLPYATNVGAAAVWVDEHKVTHKLKALDVSKAELESWQLPE